MKEFILLACLILLNAFFALAEIAIITLNDKKIKKMSANGHKAAKKVLKLIGNSGNFLATIQVGVTFSGFLTSASASQSFSEPLAKMLSFLNLSRPTLEGLSTFIVTFVLSYFSLVFGELIPKKIAMQNAEEVSFKIAGILLFFSSMFKPFIWFLNISCNSFLRCFNIDPNLNEETVTEEEILMMVDAGQEKGLIENKAKNMIAGVFDFDNTMASEVMTHRTDVTGIECTNTLSDLVNLSVKSGFSRIPMYKESIDKITGIIYIKDVLKFINNPNWQTLTLSEVSRSPIFVPSSKKCNELFSEMTTKQTQIAVVVDEYGGTEGIITMEDLLESIVGNIQDEYDQEESDIKNISDTQFSVSGATSVDDFEETTNIKIPVGDYDTIAGFLTERLGKIPKPHEKAKVELEEASFEILEVTDRKITLINVNKKNKENEEDEIN